MAEYPARRDRTRLIIIVIAIVGLLAITAGILGFVYTSSVFSSDLPPDGRVIRGSNLHQTLSISDNSTLHILGNSNTIRLNLASRVVVSLDVRGDGNSVTVCDGYVNIKIEGSYNGVNAASTRVLSESLTGQDNMVIGPESFLSASACNPFPTYHVSSI